MTNASPVIEELCRLAGRNFRGAQIRPLRIGGSGSLVYEVELQGERLVAKMGMAHKIDAEVEACRRWAALSPGVSRPILAVTTGGDPRALLGAYLGGATITELWERDGAIATLPAVDALARTMTGLWEDTVTDDPPPVVYATDITARLYALLEARPDFARLVEQPRDTSPSGRALLWQLSLQESSLMPPFTVMTHGDLTPDNVVFDAEKGTIAFLDLARSGPGDYLLDAGKFMAAELRRTERLDRPQLCAPLLAAARGFGLQRGDPHGERRLLISCARTLLGSARLVDDAHAQWRIESGLHLLAQALTS